MKQCKCCQWEGGALIENELCRECSLYLEKLIADISDALPISWNDKNQNINGLNIKQQLRDKWL